MARPLTLDAPCQSPHTTLGRRGFFFLCISGRCCSFPRGRATTFESHRDAKQCASPIFSPLDQRKFLAQTFFLTPQSQAIASECFMRFLLLLAAFVISNVYPAVGRDRLDTAINLQRRCQAE